jgi:hypothetical protein
MRAKALEGSGADPMRAPRPRADDPDKMSLTLHITPPDQIDQLVDQAVGRLDHALGTVECSDPELSPTRIRTVMRMRTRILSGEYVVDADAVAEALVERLRPAGPVSWLQARAV